MPTTRRQALAQAALDRVRTARQVNSDADENLLLGPTNDLVLRLCSFLEAADLKSLSLTAARFAEKTFAAADDAERWSIADEAARRWATAHAWAQCSPRGSGESWIWIARKLEVMSAPLSFREQPFFAVRRSADGEEVELVNGVGDPTAPWGEEPWLPAASSEVMRSGRHFAEFTIKGTGGEGMYVGVIRADWDAEGEKWSGGEECVGFENTMFPQCGRGNFFFNTRDGLFWTGGGGFSARSRPWEGQETATECDEEGVSRIGILLDMDACTMTIYKNDTKLGDIMWHDPLLRGGEFCWGASLFCYDSSLRIRKLPPPAA